MYSSKAFRFTSVFVPTNSTKGQLGSFSISSILLIPMLLYSSLPQGNGCLCCFKYVHIIPPKKLLLSPPYSNAVPAPESHPGVASLLSSQSHISFSGGYSVVKVHQGSTNSQDLYMRPQFVPSLISLETGFFLTFVSVQQIQKLKEYEKIGNISDF